MTHVMVIPSDRGGCGHYRQIWPGQAVAATRPDWQVDVVAPESVQAGFVSGKFVGMKGFPDPLPDLLVMQRVGTPGQLAALRWAQERGVATVIDFDDAMWCIDKGNSAWESWNSPTSVQSWRLCDEAATLADLVTVTTEGLANRYGRKHGRTEVIPNFVPHAATEIPRSDENERFTAGWAGFTKTHPGDCKISAPAAQAILDNGGALRVVADAPGAAAEWGVDPSLVDNIPPQPLGAEYYKALGLLDLMLVGLQPTTFNQSKSTLKVLEAGSQAVPAIAAATRPHRELVKRGFPLTTVESPSEWADAAKQYASLDGDDKLALEHAVWLATQTEHTIEGNAERWAQAWERAMKRRNG